MSIIIREKDLTAINKVSLPSLTKKELIKLSGDYRLTINYLYEKLNENSLNSAKPSSTDAPWAKARKAKNDALFISVTQLNSSADRSTETLSSPHKNKADQRKPRAKGFGRTQALHITDHEDLKPEACASCNKTFGSKDYKRYHAFHQIDLRKKESAIQYYEVTHTKYHLFEASCSDCETVTRTTLVPIKTNMSHITLSPRRLIGPELASVMKWIDLFAVAQGLERSYVVTVDPSKAEIMDDIIVTAKKSVEHLIKDAKTKVDDLTDIKKKYAAVMRDAEIYNFGPDTTWMIHADESREKEVKSDFQKAQESMAAIKHLKQKSDTICAKLIGVLAPEKVEFKNVLGSITLESVNEISIMIYCTMVLDILENPGVFDNPASALKEVDNYAQKKLVGQPRRDALPKKVGEKIKAILASYTECNEELPGKPVKKARRTG